MVETNDDYPAKKPNYKYFDIPEDKAFFAAYFNTAVQNVFITLRDIAESVDLTFSTNNDTNLDTLNGNPLWRILKKGDEPELCLRIIEKLQLAFPFAKAVANQHSGHTENERAEPKAEHYAAAFMCLLRQLYQFRNFYSHAYHQPYALESDLFYYLWELFDGLHSKVKKRFTLSNDHVEHLVRKGKGGKEKRNFYYPFRDQQQNITKNGLAFFLCLWLQRQYAQLFLKKIEGFKRSEQPEFKATLEAFTFYSIRLPKPRLKSDAGMGGLLNDMANELRKCPKALYQHISEKDQNLFKLDVAKDLDNDGDYLNTPMLRRYQNRFFYFALRYLDSNLEHLRFHVDLGNYCYHSYPQMINGVERKRQWIKHMKSFGKLDDFVDAERPEHWKQITLKPTEEKPEVYVTNTNPHYHITNNQIGLKLTGKAIWPQLPIYNQEKGSESKPNNVRADFWLSIYELPSVVFYQYLRNKNPSLTRIEDLVKQHQRQMKMFFNELADEHSYWHQRHSYSELKQKLQPLKNLHFKSSKIYFVLLD